MALGDIQKSLLVLRLLVPVVIKGVVVLILAKSRRLARKAKADEPTNNGHDEEPIGEIKYKGERGKPLLHGCHQFDHLGMQRVGSNRGVLVSVHIVSVKDEMYACILS